MARGEACPVKTGAFLCPLLFLLKTSTQAPELLPTLWQPCAAALLAKWQAGVSCRGTGCKTGATVSFNLYKIAIFSY
jgi:hypothetical protein